MESLRAIHTLHMALYTPYVISQQGAADIPLPKLTFETPHSDGLTPPTHFSCPIYLWGLHLPKHASIADCYKDLRAPAVYVGRVADPETFPVLSKAIAEDDWQSSSRTHHRWLIRYKQYVRLTLEDHSITETQALALL